MKQGSGISFDTELIYSRLMGLTSMRMLDLRTCSSVNWRPSRHRCPQKMANCVLWQQKLYWKESFSVSRLLMLFSSHVWRSSIVAQFCGQYTGRVKELCKPYVEGFLWYVISKLRDSDIYIWSYGIKNSTRSTRTTKKATWQHQLRAETPLLAQNVVLTVTENKFHMIDVICQQLVDKVAGL